MSQFDHGLSGMRQAVSSGSPYEPIFGFSRGVRIGSRILIGATAPMEADGSTTSVDPAIQTHRCLATIQTAIESLGGRMEDVVRTRVFITDASDAETIGRAHGEVFGEIRPVTGMIVVNGFVRSEWKVEIEAEAVIGGPA